MVAFTQVVSPEECSTKRYSDLWRRFTDISRWEERQAARLWLISLSSQNGQYGFRGLDIGHVEAFSEPVEERLQLLAKLSGMAAFL